MTGSTMPTSGGQKPDQVAFFWGCDNNDKRKKLGWGQKGAIIYMGKDKKNNPYFQVIMGKIKHYPNRDSSGGYGYDIEEGKNKGVVVQDGKNPLESIDKADCIIITALPDNKIELELYRRHVMKGPKSKSIKKATYGPEIT